jgi:regulator of sigma E protease
MLDEQETEEEIDPLDLPRAFNRQPLKVRIPIVIAGPLFNFLLAIVVYTVMFMIGITGMRPIVGDVAPNSPAEHAGLRSGYEILAVNGQPTALWDSVKQETLPKLINGELITYSVRDQEQHQYDITVDLSHISLDDIGQKQFSELLGIELFPAIAGDITVNSAAERAGLQTGDKIVALDDQAIHNWQTWANHVAQRPEQEIKVAILRDGEPLQLILKPERIKNRGLAGVSLPEKYFSIATERYELTSAFMLSVTKTWDISVLTLQVMGKMLTLEVSPKNISGPITIAEIAGRTAQMGLVAFLSFLGLVSVSLAVLNLLPIPILDGGHLLLYLIEGVKGSPLTENAQLLFQRVGLTIIIGLMGLAIFNDLGRLIT